VSLFHKRLSFLINFTIAGHGIASKGSDTNYYIGKIFIIIIRRAREKQKRRFSGVFVEKSLFPGGSGFYS